MTETTTHTGPPLVNIPAGDYAWQIADGFGWRQFAITGADDVRAVREGAYEVDGIIYARNGLTRYVRYGSLI